jgi:hypothetical protein
VVGRVIRERSVSFDSMPPTSDRSGSTRSELLVQDRSLSPRSHSDTWVGWRGPEWAAQTSAWRVRRSTSLRRRAARRSRVRAASCLVGARQRGGQHGVDERAVDQQVDVVEPVAQDRRHAPSSASRGPGSGSDGDPIKPPAAGSTSLVAAHDNQGGMVRHQVGCWAVIAVLAAGCATSDANQPPPSDHTDIWFAQHMVPHLLQTTTILHLAQDRITHPELARLATTMDRQGQAHLAQLQEWLASRGLAPMPGS